MLTNLGYVPTEIQNKEWFRLSDCSLKNRRTYQSIKLW